MADQFEILAKVKLDTSNIQSQLDKIKLKDINVGAKAGSGGLSDQTVKIGADTSDFEMSISVANAIMREFMEIAGQMVDQVYELDGAMTEFKKVSDLRGDALDAYVEQLGELGQVTARTTSEMVDAATSFKKSGFTDEQAKDLALVATAYQNVADEAISAGDSADFIISQMKAFNIEAEDSMHIIDAVNQVSNRYAVSSADLATNIGKASSALAIGGVEYEQALGMMTAITEINRSGAKSARGLVSIQSRYNQILDETSSTGAKLIDFYNKNNIQLYDQEGQLRSLWDTLSDVAEIWDTLDENEQKYFLNIQAGANQSVQLGALMSNFGTAIEATNTALNSSGSAMKENEAYMESLEAKTNLLNATFQELSNDVISKDMISGVLDLANNFLQLADSEAGVTAVQAGLAGGLAMSGTALLQASKIVPNLIGSFRTLFTVLSGGELAAGVSAFAGLPAAIGLATVAVVGLVAAFNGIKNALDPIVQINKAMEEFSSIQAEIDEGQNILNLTERYQELREQIESGKLSEEELASASAELDSVRGQLSSATGGLVDAEADYGEKLDQTIAKLQQATQEEINRNNARQLSTLIDSQDSYNDALAKQQELQQQIVTSTEAASYAFKGWGDSGKTVTEFYEKLEQFRDDWYEGTATEEDLNTLRAMYAGLSGDLDKLTTSENDFLEMARKGSAEINEQAVATGSAYGKVNAALTEQQATLEEYNQTLGTFESGVVDQLLSGTIGINQALGLLNKTQSDNITKTELASMTWQKVSASLREGKISTQEAIETMSRFGWTSDDVVKSLDYYWESLYGNTGKSASFVNEVNNQVDALLSLEDELANAQVALAEYQAALEGGDRGDLADTLEGEYAKAIEDIQSGYVNTKQQDAFFKLIFDKDTYEQYADDFVARAEIFNQEWMQALFNTEEGATLGTNLLDIAEYYADATTGAWVSANGELIASFDTTTGQLNSINLDTLQQEFGFSDTLITAMADDLRGLGYDVAPSKAEILGLAESMGILITSVQGVQSIDLGAFISGLAEMGRSEEEISTLVGYLSTLQEMGAIDITGTVDIEGADEAISTAIEDLNNLDNTSAEGTADVNIDPANQKLDTMEQRLDEINAEEPTPTVDLDTAPFDLGASAVRTEVNSLNNLEAHVKVYLDKQNDVSIPGNAEGTDFAEGGPTLVNEEGPEIIRDGDRAYIANGGKPTVVDMPRGAQVFTAKETKDILNGFNFDSIQALAVGAVGNSAGIKRQSSKWGSGSTSTATSPVTSAYSAGYDSGYTAASQDYSAIVEEVSATASGALNEDTVKEHQSIISLLEAEYSLMEKQGASAEELNGKAGEIQNAYHNLNEYLRGTDEYLSGDNDTVKSVVDNSAKWYEWQEKIVDNLAEAPSIYTAIQNLLSSNLDLLQAQEGSLDDQVATIHEYQDNLHTEAERLRAVLARAKELGLTDEQIAEIQTNINELGKEWWEWQDKVYEAAIKTSREYESILGLLQAEFDFLEAQNNPLTSGRRVDILNQEQEKLHEEANRLREILATAKEQGYTEEQIRDIQAQIYGLSKQWWEIEDKKTSTIKQQSREYSTMLAGLKAEYDFIEASGRDTTGQERIDILTKQQELYHEEAERLREVLAIAEELKLTEEEIADIQAEINGLSKQWWDDEKKKMELLQDYLDATLDKEKSAIDALASQMQKYYQAQIDDIDDQIDKLNEANDVLEDQIELEEKLDAIAQARSKKVMVYKDGRWQYISDTDAVSSATASYEEYERKKKLEDSIAELEKQKEAIQELKDSWSNFGEQYDDIQEQWLISQELGFDTSLDNWQSLVEGAEVWSQKYIDIMTKMANLSDLSQYADYDSMLAAMGGGGSGAGGYSGGGTTGGDSSYWTNLWASNPENTNIDYAQKILDSRSWAEAQTWADRRDMKMSALGISEEDVGSTQSYLDRFNETMQFARNAGIVSDAGVIATTSDKEANEVLDALLAAGGASSLDELVHGKHANGTLSAPGGLSLVGEKGAELRILGKGDGIIPNNLTQNLMSWGSFTPNQYASQIASITNGQNMNVTIQALNLPNVTDGMGFVDYVKNNMFGQVLQLVH